MADPLPYPGAPRWVKIGAIVAGILALLVVIVVLTGVGGPHGPSRHLSSSADANGQVSLTILEG